MSRISPYWIAIGALVWATLAAPRQDAWIAGVAAICVGVALQAGLGGRSRERIHVSGLLAFLPYFADQSVRGGIDVARRAFSPALPIKPDFLEYRIRLPAGPARVFFVNCISLLPGTFSAEFRDRALTVHLLTTSPGHDEDRLQRLEQKVSRLFGLELGGPDPEGLDPEAGQADRGEGRRHSGGGTGAAS